MLNFSTPINFLSYGYCGINILKELSKLTDVSLFPIGNIQVDENNKKFVELGIQNAKTWNREDISVKLFHQNMLDLHPLSSRYVGFPIFELDNFNKVELHHLKKQDHLFVASKWAKEVLDILGINNVSVVNLGVDSSVFYPEQYEINRQKVVFLNIGKWEKRKGHDMLAKAFYDVFRNIDDVELWMMPHNNFISKEQTKKWTDYYRSNLGNKVIFIPQLQTQNQIREIINQADVGVFPYRAEGFCLPLIEMLSCGKKVIATNYSAPVDYLTDDNSTRINPSGLELASDGVFFNGDGLWAELGEVYYNAFCEALMGHYELVKGSGKQINHNGILTAKEFSWENTAKKIIQEVNNVFGF
jgi:glycosyltransferase involved in cell wall biosynthesis